MKQNVLWLDISVDDVTVMHELYSMTNLPHHTPHLLFVKSSLLAQRSIDVASAAGFQDKVEVFLVTEEGVELHYVGMIQKALYFYFSD